MRSLPARFPALSHREPIDHRPASARDTDRDRQVVDAILAGDEAAFLALVRRWQGPMVRVARCCVGTDAAADHVARSAWGSVLEGLARWRAHGSLASYILAIVVARARALSDVDPESPGAGSDAAEEDAEVAADEEPAAAHRGPPHEWSAARLQSADALSALQRALDALPPLQRLVLTLRDVVGCGPDDVRDALGLPEVEQRALLHRARRRLRAAMEIHLDGEWGRTALGEAR